MKAKTVILLALLISILSIIAGCNKSEQEVTSCNDCFRYPIGFIETYRTYLEDGYFYYKYNNYDYYYDYNSGEYHYNDEYYHHSDNYDYPPFIKGVVTATDGSKMKIKVLEVIKGNLKSGSSITFWPSDFFLQNFVVNDTVLAIMRKLDDAAFSCQPGQKKGDYEGQPCSHSIVSLFNGYITGVINTDHKIISIPWKELQTLLSSDYHCQSIKCFVENYHENINREDVFYIKGAIIERPSYGTKIKLIEDLKGNFPKDSTIVVWGGGDASLSVDPIYELYGIFGRSSQIDTLIMLVKSIADDVPFSNRRKGDYSTIDCAYSVVPIKYGKLGWDKRRLMTPELHAKYRFVPLSWEEFQELLNTTK